MRQNSMPMATKWCLSGDKEKHIDGLIFNSQTLLGDDYRVFHQAALNAILADIKDDLGEFGVTFNQWFSEASLTEKIDEALQTLDQRGYLYEQDGNIWFKSTAFGDEKDPCGETPQWSNHLLCFRHCLSPE